MSKHTNTPRKPKALRKELRQLRDVPRGTSAVNRGPQQRAHMSYVSRGSVK